METGTVESYDADVGLGIVVSAQGDQYRFHCTAIGDGSRDIEVGRSVGFVVGPGGPGAWEARSVTPLG